MINDTKKFRHKFFHLRRFSPIYTIIYYYIKYEYVQAKIIWLKITGKSEKFLEYIVSYAWAPISFYTILYLILGFFVKLLQHSSKHLRKIWRYQRCDQKPWIQWQTTQRPKNQRFAHIIIIDIVLASKKTLSFYTVVVAIFDFRSIKHSTFARDHPMQGST